MLTADAVRSALRHPLVETDFPSLGRRYQGKVRDNYVTSSGERVLVVTDRISAFDRVLGTLPLKGQLLNRVACWWFERTRHVAPNHLVRVPDPNVMVALECEPLPVEMVVRSYLTGTTSTSIWVHYSAGAREFCGHRLPDGLRKHERLPRPLLTPSSKAAKGGHDVSMSRAEILASTGLSMQDFDAAADLALALFAEGQRICAERGLILVDTKYEFGRAPDGRILVIDEIHTPDSSRFWLADAYDARFAAGQDPDSLDKEFVRRWLAERGFTGDGPVPELPDELRVEATLRYAASVERIMGEGFEPNLEEPIARLERNLGIA
ncbi:MAG: phosphoribosylaminoimidazolesuccinocarboxamide synthase [Polyangiaceae bacterium]|nr:phosphoribosylaminoimidazolesuccinocarboxamide synthase [Polyangiaceae bacterium]